MCKSFDELPKIIAVDFDGTLVSDKWPEIGKPHKELIELLKALRQNHGVKIVLWTCRDFQDGRDYLEEAVEFCQNLGLEFDAINENIREVQELTGEDTRKVYADLYLDDKAINVVSSPLYWVEKVGVSWKELIGYIPAY